MHSDRHGILFVVQQHTNIMKITPIKRRSSRSLLLVTLGAAMSLTLGLSAARADLLFSDSFDYSEGPLVGNGPPPGSPPGQTGWHPRGGDPQVYLPGLHLHGVYSAGAAASFMDEYTDGDKAEAGLLRVNSGIVWIGFLVRERSGDSSGWAVLNPGIQFGPGYGFIATRGTYGIDNDTGSADDQAATDIAPSATPVWLVVKLNFHTGTQDLWVNPSNAGNEPDARAPDASLLMTPEFQASGFIQVVFNDGYNNGVFEFDELRIGTKFADIRTGQ